MKIKWFQLSVILIITLFVTTMVVVTYTAFNNKSHATGLNVTKIYLIRSGKASNTP